MAPAVEFSPLAAADLLDIYIFVAERASLDVADGYDKRIRAACMRLIDFPRRGTPRDDLAPGLRSLAFERRASIIYRVDGTRVIILRVLGAHRDAGRIDFA